MHQDGRKSFEFLTFDNEWNEFVSLQKKKFYSLLWVFPVVNSFVRSRKSFGFGIFLTTEKCVTKQSKHNQLKICDLEKAIWEENWVNLA